MIGGINKFVGWCQRKNPMSDKLHVGRTILERVESEDPDPKDFSFYHHTCGLSPSPRTMVTPSSDLLPFDSMIQLDFPMGPDTEKKSSISLTTVFTMCSTSSAVTLYGGAIMMWSPAIPSAVPLPGYTTIE